MRLLAILLFMAVPLRADLRGDLDAFARKALREVGTTPGMTVVVVKDNRVVYRGDFGMRDVEAKLPVTPETRFYIASSTKAFTAMAAAILAVEGKLDLDAPVTEVWPELELTAPLDAKRFSLRDFLAMRPGLANDTVNYRTGAIGNLADEQELLRVLAVYSREQPRTFRYSNMSYVLAAKVMEKATGKPWTELVAEKVLAPLGMTSTTTALPPPDARVAHSYRSSAPNVFVRSTATKSNLTMGPAGGMFTTSSDAAKWLIAMLNDGLPERAVRLVQSPQTTNKARFRFFDRFAWGLGHDLGDYEGDLLVHRFGGFQGSYSHISFMPERRIGVAVFANGGGAVADAVAAYAYDLLLGKKNLDAKWSAELARLAASAEEARAERRKAEARMAERKNPARPLDQYAGSYHYDRLGRLDVTASDGRLHAQLGIMRAELIPIGGDTFLIDWSDEGAPSTVDFSLNEQRKARLDWEGRVFERN